MNGMGIGLRPDSFGLCQYIRGTFPFSRELPEEPNTHPLETVSISAVWFMLTAYLYEVAIPLPHHRQRIFRT